MYRLSAFGRCIRDLVACRMGVRQMPPPKEELVLAEGHLHEPAVIERLKQVGHWQITDQQKEVRLELPGAEVVGHLDGRAKHNGEYVLEIKAIGKSNFAEMKSLGLHAWVKKNNTYAYQISGAMLATGLPALYAVKSRDSGEVHVDVIEEVFYKLDDFAKRAQEIDSWVDRGEYPPCEGGWCWKGPYRHIHYKDTEPDEPIPLHRKSDLIIETLTDRLYAARRKKEAAQQEEDDIKSELVQMTEPGDVFETEYHLLKVKEMTTKRLDTKALRAKYPEIWEECQHEITYPRFEVQPKG